MVFSPFAAGLRWDWVVEAIGSIKSNPPLIVVGADAGAVRKHATAGQWFSKNWDFRGHLPSAEVLRLLARAKLVLSPFIDGMTGRRTSVFASASSGSRILTSRGHLFDPFFSQGPLYVASTLEDFVTKAESLWNKPDTQSERERRVEWYRAHLDPARLDERLMEIVVA